MTDAQGVTLKPHPHELTKSVVADHVVVFGGRVPGHQFEVSGETDADSVDIDWTAIELDGDDVARILDGDTYTEQCEDPAGRTYELQVRGGDRDPKGTPVHTPEAAK